MWVGDGKSLVQRYSALKNQSNRRARRAFSAIDLCTKYVYETCVDISIDLCTHKCMGQGRRVRGNLCFTCR